MTKTPSQLARTVVGSMLTALDGLLAKAAEHAAAQDVEESVYLNWRLVPDMFPLVRQVQISTEIPARGIARLAGAAMPSFEDTETDFSALRARIKKAEAFIAELDDAAIDADPDGTVTFPGGGTEMTMLRDHYLTDFVLPNLYFHVTTTYSILRSLGVPLGKRDFLVASRFQ